MVASAMSPILASSSEQAAGVRVVEHHRHPITGPAQIQLDTPDTGVDRRVERFQGVFVSAMVVVFTAVGDDAAGSEKMRRWCRSGPSAIDPVDQAVENPFDLFFHLCASVQITIHDRIKKAFAWCNGLGYRDGSTLSVAGY
jgi:hypothetical protein